MTGSRVCPRRGRSRRYRKSLGRRGAPVFRNIGRSPNDRRLPVFPSHGPSGGVSGPVRPVLLRARRCQRQTWTQLVRMWLIRKPPGVGLDLHLACGGARTLPDSRTGVDRFDSQFPSQTQNLIQHLDLKRLFNRCGGLKLALWTTLVDHSSAVGFRWRRTVKNARDCQPRSRQEPAHICHSEDTRGGSARPSL
jgi:hypothetical protein